MPARPGTTHVVTNQSPPFVDVNLFETDIALREAVAREGGDAAAGGLTRLGAELGAADAFEMGRLANHHTPELDRYDDKGHRVDRVRFHPAYHQAMALSVREGLQCSVWDHLAAPGTERRAAEWPERLARLYMMTQVEPGHVCPITMTNAAVATLVREPDVAAPLIGRILSRTYDPSERPISDKAGITVGMGLTEKQGGSDVRANTTRAEPTGDADAPYRLVGHKWFMSAPMCDGFLVTAQVSAGLTCFWLPRILPDGTLNALRFERLKSKLGNRSNASSEVEFDGALAWRVGGEGRGVATIIEMVTMTRLDCAVASAGQMRLALALALHHCRHRNVFARPLADQPLMAGVIADMALDVEAATALSFRLAGAFARAGETELDAAWQRLMTPVTKYWVCKIAPLVGGEALECLGGNGYVEDGLAARLYRELPLNAIWEGSGNVMVLDVLRVIAKEPAALAAVTGEIERLAAGDRCVQAALARLAAILATPEHAERNGRLIVETLALAAAAALLRSAAPAIVADAFAASRLDGPFHHTYGARRDDGSSRAILERALPA